MITEFLQNLSIQDMISIAIAVIGLILALVKRKSTYFWIALAISLDIFSFYRALHTEEGIRSAILFTVVVAISALIQEKSKAEYKHTSYYAQTKKKDTILDDPYGGDYGEYLLYKELNIFTEEECRLLFNLYVPLSNTKTAEVDAVLISPYGLYILESKNYSGWIFGNRIQKNWTQTLSDGSKNRFYNPIRQNKTHCSAILKHLQKRIRFKSCIVFSDRCELKKVPASNDEYCVLQYKDIKKDIRQDMKKHHRLLSSLEIDNIYTSLYPLTQTEDSIKQQHNNSIKK